MAHSLRPWLVTLALALAIPVNAGPAAPVPGPDFDDCALLPWDPIVGAPKPPAPGNSACSESGYFQVDCGNPPSGCPIAAQHVPTNVQVRRMEVVNGACVLVEEVHTVNCGEIVRLQALPPVCPSRPLPPRTGHHVDSEGIQVFSGEGILLSVVVEDNCLNVFLCERNPFTTPDPTNPARMLLCTPPAAGCAGACALPVPAPLDERTGNADL